MKRIKIPIEKKERLRLKAGEEVLLSGRLFTARDMAHKKLIEIIKNGGRLPIGLKGEAIYYCGPTPRPPGRAIGSCGPTTSSRMDAFTPPLLKIGLGAMIGKGGRSEEVRRAIKKYGSVYFLATGGIGALLAGKIKKASVVAFGSLGAEAIYKLEVEDFPVIVGIDANGRVIYKALR